MIKEQKSAQNARKKLRHGVILQCRKELTAAMRGYGSRRSLAIGISSFSRYFATVRRATS